MASMISHTGYRQIWHWHRYSELKENRQESMDFSNVLLLVKISSPISKEMTYLGNTNGRLKR
jgi:hypothetical protein